MIASCVTLDFLEDQEPVVVDRSLEQRAVEGNIEERAADIPHCATEPASKAFLQQVKAFQSRTSSNAAPLTKRGKIGVYVHFHLVVSEQRKTKYTATMLDDQVCLSERT